MFNKTILTGFGLCIGIVLLLTLTQCAGRTAPALPKDILGISVGMDKDAAQKRLSEIGELQSEDRETGNLWRLKDDARFKHLVVAYDAENRIKFVTALVDEKTAKERVRFSEIGDLETAKKEEFAPNYRYTWEVLTADGKPAYSVSIYGTNPEHLTIFSLTKPLEAEEEEERERK